MKRVFLTSLLVLGVVMLPVAAQDISGAKAGAKPSPQAAKPGAQAKSKDAATATSKYQPAQVMAAKVHQPTGDEDSRNVRYDVTVHVADMEYVILYTPPEGIDVVKYQLGRDGLVLVGADTIKWYDMLGRLREAPILSRRTIPPKSKR
jgi:hypothetical protein